MDTAPTYPSMEWLLETFAHLKECCKREAIRNIENGFSDNPSYEYLPVVHYVHPDAGRCSMVRLSVG